MKKLPIVFPVLLALFFSVNESRAENIVSKFGIPMTTMGDVLNLSNCPGSSTYNITCKYKGKNISVSSEQEFDAPRPPLNTPVASISMYRGKYLIDLLNKDFTMLNSKYELVSKPSDRQKRYFETTMTDERSLSWLFKDNNPNNPPYIELNGLGEYFKYDYHYGSYIFIKYYTEKYGSKRFEELKIKRGDGIDDEL